MHWPQRVAERVASAELEDAHLEALRHAQQGTLHILFEGLRGDDLCHLLCHELIRLGGLWLRAVVDY